MWKVVAADDEGYIREALKKLINWEKMNCDLESVLEDGQELIQCIENESPDIVITDIQMPGVNGLEVCKYLYETRPETQVIILTAYSDFDYAKFAIKYNACEYVLKISIMDELPEALEKATGKLTQLKKEIEKEEIAVSGQRTLLQQIDQYVEQNFKNKISLAAKYWHHGTSIRLHTGRENCLLLGQSRRSRGTAVYHGVIRYRQCSAA